MAEYIFQSTTLVSLQLACVEPDRKPNVKFFLQRASSTHDPERTFAQRRSSPRTAVENG